jgi:hypothetical protein
MPTKHEYTITLQLTLADADINAISSASWERALKTALDVVKESDHPDRAVAFDDLTWLTPTITKVWRELHSAVFTALNTPR